LQWLEQCSGWTEGDPANKPPDGNDAKSREHDNHMTTPNNDGQQNSGRPFQQSTSATAIAADANDHLEH